MLTGWIRGLGSLIGVLTLRLAVGKGLAPVWLLDQFAAVGEAARELLVHPWVLLHPPAVALG